MVFKDLHDQRVGAVPEAVHPRRQRPSPTEEPPTAPFHPHPLAPGEPLPRPLPLRGHMALCLLGFRGSGYSPGFVESMQAIQDGLKADPAHPVALVDEPDRICGSCPNLAPHGCTLGGPSHEDHMRSHDREVLRRLDLKAGSELPWQAILDRIGASIAGSDLDAICTTCPWLPLGVCRDSVDALCGSPPEAH